MLLMAVTLSLVPQGEPEEISKEKCRIAAREVSLDFYGMGEGSQRMGIRSWMEPTVTA